MSTTELFITEGWLRAHHQLVPGSDLVLPSGARLTPAASSLLTTLGIEVQFETLPELFVTETWLREKCHLVHGGELELPAHAKLTPSAKGLLTDRRITVKYIGEIDPTMPDIPVLPDNSVTAGCETVPLDALETIKTQIRQELINEVCCGDQKKTLPERTESGIFRYVHGGRSEGRCALCHQSVNDIPKTASAFGSHVVVAKNDSRLRLQGRLEHAIAQTALVYAQVCADGCDIDEILQYTKDIRAALVQIKQAMSTSQIVSDMVFAGMAMQKIKSISENPLASLGVDHLLVDGTEGLIIAHLNMLRADIQAAQLEAAATYMTVDFKLLRQDVVSALADLGSAVYVLMLMVFARRQDRSVSL